jgi:hypothetical protein
MRRFSGVIATSLFLLATAFSAGETGTPAAKDASTAQVQPAAAVPDRGAMQPFTSAEGMFKINFPGTPQESAKPLTLQGGGVSTLHQFWVDEDFDYISYMVIYNDYPADYASASPQELLETMRDGVVRDKTLTSDVPIELFGVPGRAFTAVDKDGWQYAVHQFLAGSRLYQLIVVNSKNHPPATTEEFMNTFRILKSPATNAPPASAPAPPPAG